MKIKLSELKSLIKETISETFEISFRNGDEVQVKSEIVGRNADKIAGQTGTIVNILQLGTENLYQVQFHSEDVPDAYLPKNALVSNKAQEKISLGYESGI